MTDLRAVAVEIVFKINDQRNRIAGGYDVPDDEPGPVTLIRQALTDARRQVWEEAAKLCETSGMQHSLEWWQAATKKEISAQTAKDLAAIIRAQASQEG